MPTSSVDKGDSVTFRIDPSLKAELTRLAAKNRRSLGSLMRDLVRERVALESRRVFEAEARRQAREAAAAAHDPEADEYKVMRELDADLAEFGDEWK